MAKSLFNSSANYADIAIKGITRNACLFVSSKNSVVSSWVFLGLYYLLPE